VCRTIDKNLASLLKHRFWKNKWEQWNKQVGSLKHLKKRGSEDKVLLKCWRHKTLWPIDFLFSATIFWNLLVLKSDENVLKLNNLLILVCVVYRAILGCNPNTHKKKNLMTYWFFIFGYKQIDIIYQIDFLVYHRCVPFFILPKINRF